MGHGCALLFKVIDFFMGLFTLILLQIDLIDE